MSKRINLTEGSILKSLITLAIPIVFANVLQTAYQLTDTFWVGRLGANAVAAVSISFPIIFLIISLGAGLSMAGTILVAQYKGRNNQKAINHVTLQTLMMVVIVSTILAIFGYVISPFLINLMGVEPLVYAEAVSYMKISFIGMVFVFIYMVFQSLMRGVGDVKTPFYIVLGTVILNLFLDPLFIFGYKWVPAYGVRGAAAATIITQGIAAIIGIFLLVKGKYNIQLNLRDLKLDLVFLKRIFMLGFPASIEQSTRALGMTIMTFLVTKFGTNTVAAYGVGSRVLSFVIIPAMGLSMAATTLVGQNVGARKPDRVAKVVKLSSWISFGFLTIVGVFVFLFANTIASIFIPGETQTILSSALFIKIMALFFGFIGVQMTFNGVFRGIGNTLVSMVLSIVSLWVLRFPVAYILSMHTKLNEVGIWIAFPVSDVISALIIIFWYYKGTWKQKSLHLSDVVTQETIVEEGLD